MKKILVALFVIAFVLANSSDDAHGQLRRRMRSDHANQVQYSAKVVTSATPTLDPEPSHSLSKQESDSVEISPEPEASNAQIQPQAAPQSDAIKSNCDCNGNSQPNPNCNATDCKYRPLAGQPTSSTTSKQYGPIRPPSLDCNPTATNIPFYSEEIKADATLEVPEAYRECKEVIRFERETIKVCGCSITICVPCAIDCRETKGCKLTRKTIPVSVRKRTDQVNGANVYDVWVVDPNVKELPIPSVVGTQMTTQAMKQELGISF